ncbi:polysaccharide pyruvyl transferase family protein [Microbacterium sp. No. 7]|uniref:polysaccharide pyruvyl transferase family protein n=1 Tax=Microbacterium sp. No. 7 TaxID=1714373 RepID=UPI0006D0C51E|nr:polysaccharide pyruvyl transferase family protein [Microbacterium sp. No. 7]ALJ19078.1 hypothetical protein AOA12_03825 [Microbacterium sp. No. 7]
MSSKRPLALVVGANFENQGANLMLLRVRDKLAEWGWDVVLDYSTGTPEQRAQYGVRTLAPRKVERNAPWADLSVLNGVLPSRLRFVYPREISAVLDISGFRYADQWTRLNLEGSARRLEAWSQRGRAVVMLPQAFGPFEETADPARTLLGSCAVIYARDPDSYRYLSELATASGLDGANIRQSPDFTAEQAGRAPAGLQHLAGAVPLVPNWNIRERLLGNDTDAYLDVLEAFVTEVRAAGLTPYGLSHEGDRDLAILTALRERTGDLELVSGLRELELKALIGSAHVVVSGRFHAVSSALAQSVPTLVHSWSHKYAWMGADYGVREFVVDPARPAHEQVEVLRGLLARREEVSQTIRAASETVEASVARMWDDLDGILRSVTAAR